MDEAKLTQKVTDLFRAAGAAHHQAYLETDGADPEWPLWYAGYLGQPLGELLDTEFTQSELTYLLVLAEKTRQQSEPDSPWAEYYARFFVERAA